jgi:hypothetical protein
VIEANAAVLQELVGTVFDAMVQLALGGTPKGQSA